MTAPRCSGGPSWTVTTLGYDYCNTYFRLCLLCACLQRRSPCVQFITAPALHCTTVVLCELLILLVYCMGWCDKHSNKTISDTRECAVRRTKRIAFLKLLHVQCPFRTEPQHDNTMESFTGGLYCRSVVPCTVRASRHEPQLRAAFDAPAPVTNAMRQGSFRCSQFVANLSDLIA